MAQDTTIANAAPGIATFASQTFGGPKEVLYGDTPVTTTDESVTTSGDLTLPIYSVVSLSATGVLAHAVADAVAGGSATGTFTASTAVPADGDTVTVNGRVYTYKTALSVGPAVAYEVLAGVTVTAAAANLAAAINGGAGIGTTYSTGTVLHPDVSATSSAGVVTFLARNPGDEGNAITLAKTFATGANGTVSGAVLTGGSDDPDLLPYGVITHPIAMLNGVAMSVSFIRTGHLNMNALNWHSSFVTDAQKKHAFENSRSPGILISKPRYNDDQIAL